MFSPQECNTRTSLLYLNRSGCCNRQPQGLKQRKALRAVMSRGPHLCSDESTNSKLERWQSAMNTYRTPRGRIDHPRQHGEAQLQSDAPVNPQYDKSRHYEEVLQRHFPKQERPSAPRLLSPTRTELLHPPHQPSAHPPNQRTESPRNRTLPSLAVREYGANPLSANPRYMEQLAKASSQPEPSSSISTPTPDLTGARPPGIDSTCASVHSRPQPAASTPCSQCRPFVFHPAPSTDEPQRLAGMGSSGLPLEPPPHWPMQQWHEATTTVTTIHR